MHYLLERVKAIGGKKNGKSRIVEKAAFLTFELIQSRGHLNDSRTDSAKVHEAIQADACDTRKVLALQEFEPIPPRALVS